VAAAQKRRVGQTLRVLVDGPAAEHALVLRGRLEGQAPDIDPLVYLSECDPSKLTAGQFVDVEITGARGYDLVARPTSVEVPARLGTALARDGRPHCS
jgi:ribosomal protein S12 methylthiotransferase